MERSAKDRIVGGRLSALIENFFFFPMRRRVRLEYERRQIARDSALREVESSLMKASAAGFTSIANLYNAALFTLLIDQDIADYTLQLVLAKVHRQRVFVARGTSVLLYEATEDVPRILGKEYRQDVGIWANAPEVMNRLNSGMAQVNQFKSNHSQFLRNIRVLVGAHRDHDAMKQIQLLRDLDPMIIGRLVAEYSSAHRELVDAQILVMEHLAIRLSTVNQFLNSMVDAPSSDGIQSPVVDRSDSREERRGSS